MTLMLQPSRLTSVNAVQEGSFSGLCTYKDIQTPQCYDMIPGFKPLVYNNNNYIYTSNILAI